MSNTPTNLAERLEALRKRYPTPDVSGIKSFRFTFDGGGRHIIRRLIDQSGARLMAEIGVFLGGSCYDWLEHEPDLTVIAIDPWTDGYSAAASLRSYHEAGKALQAWRYIEDREAAIRSTEKHGFFKQAMANLAPFGDRVIPVRAKAAKALPELRELGLIPKIVYIDSNKTRASIDEAYAAFPNAHICGDDWGWRDADGKQPMNQAVTAFAEERGKRVVVSGATWIVAPRPQPR